MTKYVIRGELVGDFLEVLTTNVCIRIGRMHVQGEEGRLGTYFKGANACERHHIRSRPGGNVALEEMQ